MTRTSILVLTILCIGLPVTGCAKTDVYRNTSDAQPSDTDADANTDTDIDADSDTDSDTDTTADSDTDVDTTTDVDSDCADEHESCTTETCCEGLLCCDFPGFTCTTNIEECPVSDRNLKENFNYVDVDDVLERVTSLTLAEWNYIADDDTTRHMGPMAQDFYTAFGLGADNRHIHTLDSDGVSLASIQALCHQIQTLRLENDELRNENTTVRAELERLRQRTQAIEQTLSSRRSSSSSYFPSRRLSYDPGIDSR